MSELLHSPDAELAALKARVARLERLEEQVYFQERTLSALNEAITLQQRQLTIFKGVWKLLRRSSVSFGSLSATKAAKRPCPRII